MALNSVSERCCDVLSAAFHRKINFLKKFFCDQMVEKAANGLMDFKKDHDIF